MVTQRLDRRLLLKRLRTLANEDGIPKTFGWVALAIACGAKDIATKGMARQFLIEKYPMAMESPDIYKNRKTKPVTMKYLENVSKPKKIKKKNDNFYMCREWRELRYRALLLHGRKCMCCGAAPPYVTLHVDHIKPRSKHPELQLDISNLQVLCEDCNLGKSNKDKTDFRPMLIKGGKE